MRVRGTALLLVVLALAAAGCGGGKKSNAVADSSVGTTSTTPTTTASGTTTSATSTKPKSCKELTSLANRVSAAFQNSNPKNIEKNAKLLKQFADQTPEEIRPDFELIASDVQDIADTIKGVKNPSKPTAAERQRIQKAAASIDQTKLNAAIQHISAWSTKNC
jgi:hypothetical protein